MFSKLSSQQIENLIPYFQIHPKFALFANAAKFEVEGRLPNHPCDFYYLESNGSKYFYVFRHDNIPDECRPILMIGCDQKLDENDVVIGLEQMKLVESKLGNIEMLVTSSDISKQAREFFITNYDREDYNNPCYHFYVPSQPASKGNLNLPPSFSIGSTKLSNSEIVNATWKFGTPGTVLQIREIIQRLPTVCIYHENNPISFEMVGLHGQLNHQFTFPEFRNKGFGGIVEKTIIDECFKEGIQVVKAVEIGNEAVVRRSLNDGLWKMVQHGNEEPLFFDYTHYH